MVGLPFSRHPRTALSASSTNCVALRASIAPTIYGGALTDRQQSPTELELLEGGTQAIPDFLRVRDDLYKGWVVV